VKTLRAVIGVLTVALALLALLPVNASSQLSYFSGSRMQMASGSVFDGATYGAAAPNTVFLIGADPTQGQTLFICKTCDNPLTNYEAGTIGWAGNIFGVSTTKGGTGVDRAISFGNANGGWTITAANANLTGGSGDMLVFGPSGGGIQLGSKIVDVNTSPTISSGFGTSPTIPSANGTVAFTVNVGTGGVATTGVIGLPAATTGWYVHCDDVTTQTATVFVTKQIATTTTTATIGSFDQAGVASAWVASNVLVCAARGY
jgi:hypothetical protein